MRPKAFWENFPDSAFLCPVRSGEAFSAYVRRAPPVAPWIVTDAAAKPTDGATSRVSSKVPSEIPSAIPRRSNCPIEMVQLHSNNNRPATNVRIVSVRLLNKSTIGSLHGSSAPEPRWCTCRARCNDATAINSSRESLHDSPRGSARTFLSAFQTVALRPPARVTY